MSCSARLINEAGSPLTLFADGVALSAAAPSTAAAYAAYNCSAALTLSGSVPVPAPGGNGGARRLSVLATESAAKGALSAVALEDASAPYDDDSLGRNIDVAEVRLVNAGGAPLYVFGVPTECYNCAQPLLLGAPVAHGAAASLNVSTKYGWAFCLSAARSCGTLAPAASVNGAPADALPRLAEHGRYTLLVRASGAAATLLTDVEGRNANAPLLYLLLAVLAAFALHRAAVWAAARCGGAAARAGGARARGAGAPPPERRAVTPASFFALDTAFAAGAAAALAEGGGADAELHEGLVGSAGSLQEPAPRPRSEGAPRARAERVLAIDTFRGISLCIMIFVNAHGGDYYYLNHSKWNGLTVADLVFPWFVFTSGLSAALSLAVEKKRGATARALFFKQAQRSLKLAAIGIFIMCGFSRARCAVGPTSVHAPLPHTPSRRQQ